MARAMQKRRGRAIDPAERDDPHRALPAKRGEAKRAERYGARVAPRGEDRRQQGEISNPCALQLQCGQRMGGNADHPGWPLPLQRCGAVAFRLRQMYARRPDGGREPGVARDKQQDAAPAAKPRQRRCEGAAAGRLVVTEDHPGTARQRRDRRQRIGQPAPVGHQPERRQRPMLPLSRLPGLEAPGFLC